MGSAAAEGPRTRSGRGLNNHNGQLILRCAARRAWSRAGLRSDREHRTPMCRHWWLPRCGVNTTRPGGRPGPTSSRSHRCLESVGHRPGTLAAPSHWFDFAVARETLLLLVRVLHYSCGVVGAPDFASLASAVCSVDAGSWPLMTTLLGASGPLDDDCEQSAPRDGATRHRNEPGRRAHLFL